MNARRFPRTAGEAFKGADYASAIYRFVPRAKFIDRFGYFIGLALIAGALSMAWWH